MPESISDRVRRVIADSGKTQREVAKLIDLDASKLSKSLKGVRNFSSYELASIAEIGGQTVEWLLTGTEPRRLKFAHRTRITDRESVDSTGRATAAMIAERFHVAQQLGFAPEVTSLPNEPRSNGFLQTADRWAKASIARAPQVIRELDTRGLLKMLEEQFGINAVVEELPEGIDGLSYARDDVRIVVVASTDRSGRQRFTIAHELGHVLFGDGDQEVIEEQLFSPSSGNVEPRANAFAAAFLMPAHEIEEVLNGRDPVETFNELVWSFRVSPDAMAWRLKNLKLLSDDVCRSLGARTLNAVAAQLGKLNEHGDRIRESSVLRPAGRLSGAYIGAFLAGEVAAAPVAEIAGITVNAVYRMREELTLPDEWPDLFDTDR